MEELAYFVIIRCELMHNGLFVILSQDGPVCFCSKSAKVSSTLFVSADLLLIEHRNRCPSQVSHIEQKEIKEEINHEIFYINFSQLS